MSEHGEHGLEPEFLLALAMRTHASPSGIMVGVSQPSVFKRVLYSWMRLNPTYRMQLLTSPESVKCLLLVPVREDEPDASSTETPEAP